MLIVYTRTTCAPCAQIKRYLKAKNIDFVEKPAEGDDYQTYADMYGFTVPLVVKEDKGFAGLNLALLNDLIAPQA